MTCEVLCVVVCSIWNEVLQFNSNLKQYPPFFLPPLPSFPPLPPLALFGARSISSLGRCQTHNLFVLLSISFKWRRRRRRCPSSNFKKLSLSPLHFDLWSSFLARQSHVMSWKKARLELPKYLPCLYAIFSMTPLLLLRCDIKHMNKCLTYFCLILQQAILIMIIFSQAIAQLFSLFDRTDPSDHTIKW